MQKHKNQKYLTRSESREVDRTAIDQWGYSGLVLMENAGRGATDYLEHLFINQPGCRVGVLCGPGNNGGDGFVIARHLKIRGACPTVYLAVSPDRLQGDAAANYSLLNSCSVPVKTILTDRTIPETWEKEMASCTILVDALLGTGATGSPRQPYAELIRIINKLHTEKGTKVLAVDLPSGLDADTGLPADPTVQADATVTFFAPKIGFSVPASIPYVGKLCLADIGVPTLTNDKYPDFT